MKLLGKEVGRHVGIVFERFWQPLLSPRRRGNRTTLMDSIYDWMAGGPTRVILETETKGLGIFLFLTEIRLFS